MSHLIWLPLGNPLTCSYGKFPKHRPQGKKWFWKKKLFEGVRNRSDQFFCFRYISFIPLVASDYCSLVCCLTEMSWATAELNNLFIFTVQMRSKTKGEENQWVKERELMIGRGAGPRSNCSARVRNHRNFKLSRSWTRAWERAKKSNKFIPVSIFFFKILCLEIFPIVNKTSYF